MPRSVLAVIEFDDNTPPNEPAFTNEGSVWSLQEDWGLLGCKDCKFIGAISGIQNSTPKGPLIPLRGLPRNAAQSVKQLQDELATGWLTYNEIMACLDHHSVKVESLHPAVRRVLDVMRLLGAKFSEDRVRLVFAIDV